jgi:acetyltransferase
MPDAAVTSLKPVAAEDAAALAAFFQRVSAHTRRLRFHGAAGVSHSLALRMCSVDGARHQAWLAWRDGLVIGEARFVASACSHSAELAIVVADEWHGRGVARALMGRLVDAARAAGVRELYGDVLDDNRCMQAFMRGHGFEVDPFAHGETLRMTRALNAAPQRKAARTWWEGLAAWWSAAFTTSQAAS